ncbi:MAG: hypothetical protein MK193_05845 [Lentisphaeria bacterium]|nr:hypothetical protein [Lentisphaeria bacterium]
MKKAILFGLCAVFILTLGTIWYGRVSHEDVSVELVSATSEAALGEQAVTVFKVVVPYLMKVETLPLKVPGRTAYRWKQTGADFLNKYYELEIARPILGLVALPEAYITVGDEILTLPECRIKVVSFEHFSENYHPRLMMTKVKVNSSLKDENAPWEQWMFLSILLIMSVVVMWRLSLKTKPGVMPEERAQLRLLEIEEGDLSNPAEVASQLLHIFNQYLLSTFKVSLQSVEELKQEECYEKFTRFLDDSSDKAVREFLREATHYSFSKDDPTPEDILNLINLTSRLIQNLHPLYTNTEIYAAHA